MKFSVFAILHLINKKLMEPIGLNSRQKSGVSSHVKNNALHETSARDWCTGKTQSDGVGREVGGGSVWGHM